MFKGKEAGWGLEVEEVSRYSRWDEIWACLALTKARSLGCKTWQKILEVFRSPAQALAQSKYWAEMGLVTPSQAKKFQAGDWEEQARQEYRRIEQKGLQLLIWSDPEYPELLRHITGPPILLYYSGDISLVHNPSLAVVGSRKSSVYGRKMTAGICETLSREGMTIVSGFADGIDREAHRAALSGPGSTIAVLGTGIDLIYPAANKKLWLDIRDRGLILTEFPLGTKPEAGNFPYRNRLISGLSLGVMVAQATTKSGSMITAGYALEQNREVFAVPGEANQESYAGCHHLIKEGALLVQSAEDILEVLRPRLQKVLASSQGKEESGGESRNKLPQDLGSEEKVIAQAIVEQGRLHIDDLASASGLSVSRVSQVLVHLEIKGVVRKEPGMYYALA